MKKKILMTLLGIMLFIPSIKAQEITKEQLVNKLNEYKASFNEFAESYEYDETIYGSPKKIELMEVTIIDDHIIVKNDDYETKIEFNDDSNTLYIKHDLLPEIDADSTESEKEKRIEYAFYRSSQKRIIISAALSIKEIDKEVGIDALQISWLITDNGGLNGISNPFYDEFSIYLNDLEIIKSDKLPTFTIEKIDDTSIKIEPTNMEEEDDYIFVLEYIDGYLYSYLNVPKEGRIIEDINLEKEYMFKAAFAGTMNYSDDVYYNKKEQVIDKQETSIENPNTGIKTYGTLGIATLIVLGIIYKSYKGKMSNI